MDDEKENLVDEYWLKLKEGSPAVTLLNFYCELYKLPFNKEMIPLFGRLVRIFGRESLFFSIVDTGTVSELKHEEVHRLLYYFCQKRLESSKVLDVNQDLSDSIEKLSKLANRATKAKLVAKEPFSE